MPIVMEVLEINMQAGHVRFDGYWSVENEENPLPETVLCTVYPEDDASPTTPHASYYLLRITEHNRIEDKSIDSAFYDEDIGHDICLFPSLETELKFEIIEHVTLEQFKSYVVKRN